MMNPIMKTLFALLSLSVVALGLNLRERCQCQVLAETTKLDRELIDRVVKELNEDDKSDITLAQTGCFGKLAQADKITLAESEHCPCGCTDAECKCCKESQQTLAQIQDEWKRMMLAEKPK